MRTWDDSVGRRLEVGPSRGEGLGIVFFLSTSPGWADRRSKSGPIDIEGVYNHGIIGEATMRGEDFPESANFCIGADSPDVPRM
jgi:hypothetical protein